MQTSYIKNGSTLELKAEKCTGCGICITVCPHQVLKTAGNKVEVVNRRGCMECGACMMNCPFEAIQVRKGVGCASAIISGALRGTEPECGCSGGGTENSGDSGCGSGCCC